MFVYQIVNSVNNKKYIGITTCKNPLTRFYRHKSNAKLGIDGFLYNAIRKYGVDNFKFQVLEIANSIEELCYLEKYYIKFYNTLNKNFGYNINSGGIYFTMNQTLKDKISKARKNQYKLGYKNSIKAFPYNQTKRVICLNDGKIFNSYSDADRFYKLPLGAVSQVCRKTKESYKKLRFKTIPPQ